MVGVHKIVWQELRFLIIMVIFTFAACQPAQRSPLSSSTPQTKTATPTQQASSLQPASTCTFQSNPTPDAQATMTAIVYFFSEQAVGFNVTCDHLAPSTSLSPSGNWFALACGVNHDPILEIVNKAGKRWILNFHDYLLPGDYFDYTEGMIHPIYWTSDEQYLYFAVSISFDPGGHGCPYSYGPYSLNRIDLENGTASTVLSPTANRSGYNFAFSPDGGKLAYASTSNGLNLVDMRTGEITLLIDKGGLVGNLIWSPDGSALAFTKCQINHLDEFTNSEVTILDLNSFNTSVVLRVGTGLVYLIDHAEDQSFEIAGYDPAGNEFHYNYDWESMAFTQATAEP